LSAHRGLNNQWRVPFDPEIEAACHKRIAVSGQIHRPESNEPRAELERTVHEVGAELGVSIYTVYYWIEHRYIPCRRASAGRWLIDFDETTKAECRRRIAASAQLNPPTLSQTARSTRQEAV
jgi:hypothetical protein